MQEKTKILVVDDDPDIREAVSIVLEAHSYQVVTAVDGEDGLAKLKDERPDLLILDLIMPKMDGFSVLKELRDPRRSKYAHIPILVLTSISEDHSRRRYELETGLELNVDDYVEKPLDPPVLIERMEKLLQKRA
ncbi:MAG: response regulator [Chloroflexi bacterium]|jgi:adenylate cyclase|nr:response regulator [Chloroflexota bacterium]MBT7082579.1 response regulator [Chloroflexota bacterium]MBT7289124.1 response regulator [Chloroflexota bacterium]